MHIRVTHFSTLLAYYYKYIGRITSVNAVGVVTNTTLTNSDNKGNKHFSAVVSALKLVWLHDIIKYCP